MSRLRTTAICATFATMALFAGALAATWFERSRALDLSDRELADSIDRNLLTLERLAAGDIESIRATAQVGVDTGWVQIRRMEEAGGPIPQELELFIDRLRARTAAVAVPKDGA